MSYIKQHKKISIILFFIFICTIMLGYTIYLNTHMKIIENSAMVMTYDDLEALEQDSTYILIGQPTEDLEDRNNDSLFSESGTETSYSTLTNFSIDKVLKAPEVDSLIHNDRITIVEPIKLESTLSGKVLTMMEGYNILEKDKTYLVFLVDNASLTNFELGGGISLDENSVPKSNANVNDDKSKKKAEILTKYLPIYQGTE